MALNNSKFENRVITGKAYWACLLAPNTTFEPCWQIDISLDDASKKIVERDGLTVKNKGDSRGDFVSLKRKVSKRDGSTRKAPRVVDAKNTPWDDRSIGNGSLVTVKYHVFEWSVSGRSGKSGELDAIQVVDLVPYEKKDSFSVIPGGYALNEGDAFSL